MVTTTRLKKNYEQMFKGEDVNDLEEMILKHKADTDILMDAQRDIKITLNQIREDHKKSFTKSAIYKYDAFKGLGGRLSFVYVLLDGTNSGIIINGIFGSEGHYVYIKEIREGQADKELSNEEKITLDKAIGY